MSEKEIDSSDPVERWEGKSEDTEQEVSDVSIRTFWDRLFFVLKNDRLALGGIIVTMIVVIIGVAAPIIAPHDPYAASEPFVAPMSRSADGTLHILGTNSFGQDVLSRIIYGTRISLGIAVAAAAFALVIGTLIGLAAGFYGGWIDDLLMRYIDFQWAFPSLILAIAVIAYIGSVGAANVILALGIAYIDDFARLVRGEVLSIREKEYIMAAKAVGMSNWRIMTREILPNAVSVIIVQLTLMLPLAILGEAGLSFLGVGVAVDTPSWGMLLGRGQRYINTAWWLSVFPGIAIVITVIAFNLFGDGLRDAFDTSEQIEGEATQ